MILLKINNQVKTYKTHNKQTTKNKKQKFALNVCVAWEILNISFIKAFVNIIGMPKT